MLVDIFMENIDEFLEIKKKYADKIEFEKQCFFSDQGQKKRSLSTVDVPNV